MVREDKRKGMSFASELKKLTSRSRSVTSGGAGSLTLATASQESSAHSKDERAACCVSLTETLHE